MEFITIMAPFGRICLDFFSKHQTSKSKYHGPSSRGGWGTTFLVKWFLFRGHSFCFVAAEKNVEIRSLTLQTITETMPKGNDSSSNHWNFQGLLLLVSNMVFFLGFVLLVIFLRMLPGFINVNQH